jgi:hypothetical protein
MTLSLSNEVRHSVVTDPVTITRVDPAWTGANGNAIGFLKHSDQACGAGAIPIYRERVKAMAETYCRQHTLVHLEIATAVSGRSYVRDIARAAEVYTGSCLTHRWDWLTPMVLKCRRCGFLKRSDR